MIPSWMPRRGSCCLGWPSIRSTRSGRPRSVAFFRLPVGSAAREVSDATAPISDLSASLTDWPCTAGVLSQLDLLITCDTGIAHLAGALGRPVWICLPASGDWRWLLERSDTPWYHARREGEELVARIRAARPGLPIVHLDDASTPHELDLPADVPNITKRFTMESSVSRIAKMLPSMGVDGEPGHRRS